MRRRRARLLAIFSFCCLSAIMVAQPAAEDVPEVEMEVKVMSIGRGGFDGILLQSRDQEEPLLMRFSRYRRSEPIRYVGAPDLVFFRLEPSGDPESPWRRRAVASFAVDAGRPVRDLLLFFLPLPEPDADTGMVFQVFGMDDSFEAFPRDTAIIFNATGATLYGQVNRRSHIFGAGASGAFSLNRDFNAAFAIETRDGPRLVFENTLEFSEDLRAIVMLRPPRRARSIRIVSYNIIERLDPLPAE